MDLGEQALTLAAANAPVLLFLLWRRRKALWAYAASLVLTVAWISAFSFLGGPGGLAAGFGCLLVLLGFASLGFSCPGCLGLVTIAVELVGVVLLTTDRFWSRAPFDIYGIIVMTVLGLPGPAAACLGAAFRRLKENKNRKLKE